MSSVKSILIGTPMYGGQCTGVYHTSIINFFHECSIRGIAVSFMHTYNESLIQRARNDIASNFLNTGQDVLLFIDADIKFDAKAMLDMVLEDKDVIGAVTPLKMINYDKVIQLSIMGNSSQKSQHYGASYNFNQDITHEIEEAVINDNSFEVERIGTGVLSIKRVVLEKMVNQVSRYVNDNPSGKKEFRFDFFPVTVQYDEHWGANRLMSEDYNFCNKWRELGGKVWAKDGIVLSHSGSYEFMGSLKEEISVIRKIRLENAK